MAIHAGDVRIDDYGVTGRPKVVLARLLDAEPLRAALAEAPDTATVAVIVSDSFHDDVVCHGHEGIDPDLYAPVTVRVKETEARAWLHIPGHAPLSSTPIPTNGRIHRDIKPGGVVLAAIGDGEGSDVDPPSIGADAPTAPVSQSREVLVAAGVFLVSLIAVSAWLLAGRGDAGAPTQQPAQESQLAGVPEPSETTMIEEPIRIEEPTTAKRPIRKSRITSEPPTTPTTTTTTTTPSEPPPPPPDPSTPTTPAW